MDDEVKAMDDISKALAKLDKAARRRVMSWMNDRFGAEIQAAVAAEAAPAPIEEVAAPQQPSLAADNPLRAADNPLTAAATRAAAGLTTQPIEPAQSTAPEPAAHVGTGPDGVGPEGKDAEGAGPQGAGAEGASAEGAGPESAAEEKEEKEKPVARPKPKDPDKPAFLDTGYRMTVGKEILEKDKEILEKDKD